MRAEELVMRLKKEHHIQAQYLRRPQKKQADVPFTIPFSNAASVLTHDKCNNHSKPLPSKNTKFLQPQTYPNTVVSKDSILHINAHLIRVPGDGSCMFHAICHFLPGITATQLRRQVADVMIQYPEMSIGDQPLSAWIQQDAQMSVQKYAKHIEKSNTWGGGIEMSVIAQIKAILINVYSTCNNAKYFCIASFGKADALRTAHILHSKNIHYDVLEPINNDAQCTVSLCH